MASTEVKRETRKRKKIVRDIMTTLSCAFVDTVRMVLYHQDRAAFIVTNAFDQGQPVSSIAVGRERKSKVKDSKERTN